MEPQPHLLPKFEIFIQNPTSSKQPTAPSLSSYTIHIYICDVGCPPLLIADGRLLQMDYVCWQGGLRMLTEKKKVLKKLPMDNDEISAMSTFKAR